MRPSQAEHVDIAGVRREQSLENLDRRRLAGAVRTEQAKAFTALHRQRQVVNSDDGAVTFAQSFTRNRVLRHAGILQGHSRPSLTICSYGRLPRSGCHLRSFRASAGHASRTLHRVSSTILIAASTHLAALQQHPDLTDADAFADTDALKALDAITQRRPQVVALEPTFAASARGAAFINRIKADPALASCEIRILQA